MGKSQICAKMLGSEVGKWGKAMIMAKKLETDSQHIVELIVEVEAALEKARQEGGYAGSALIAGGTPLTNVIQVYWRHNLLLNAGGN